MKTLWNWLQSENGATAIEYGLIAGGVALVIVAAVVLIGGDLEVIFNAMETSINSAASRL